MLDVNPLNGRNVALVAAVLLAVAAAALLSGAASAAPGGVEADAPSAREARAAGSPADDRRLKPHPVREWAAAWNTGDGERMAALFTKDGVYEDHAFGAVFEGRDNVALWVSITNGAIDDGRVEVHDAFRSGDKIAVQWTFSGKDTATGLAGQPPTGNSFSVPAVSVFDMKGNKIERVDDYYNLADLLGQLGRPSGAAEPFPAP